MSPRRLGSRTALLALAGLAALLIAGPASASAAGGWWVLTATAAPTNLQPGQPAVVNFKASNTGYGTIVGSKEHPIVLRATLPAGFEATKSLEGFAGPENNAPVVKRERHKLACKVEGRTVTCPWEGSIPPTESIRMKAAGVMKADDSGWHHRTGDRNERRRCGCTGTLCQEAPGHARSHPVRRACVMNSGPKMKKANLKRRRGPTRSNSLRSSISARRSSKSLRRSAKPKSSRRRRRCRRTSTSSCLQA